jgi:hypothetical protein
VPRCHSPPYSSLVTAIMVEASEYLAYSLDFIPSDLKSERSNVMVCGQFTRKVKKCFFN